MRFTFDMLAIGIKLLKSNICDFQNSEFKGSLKKQS